MDHKTYLKRWWRRQRRNIIDAVNSAADQIEIDLDALESGAIDGEHRKFIEDRIQRNVDTIKEAKRRAESDVGFLKDNGVVVAPIGPQDFEIPEL